MGYAWSGAFPGSLTMLQVTSLVGIYGLSLVTVTAAVLPATLGDLGGRRWPPLIAAGALIAACFAYGWARLDAVGMPGMQPDVRIRIVQASIPQTLKNDPSERLRNFRRQLALSSEPAETGAPFNVLIWPEASAPPLLDRDVAARMAIAALLPANGLALVGSQRSDPPPGPLEHFWNSMVAVDHAGTIQGYYDKAHLVPFGEYVPFRGVLPMDKITPGTTDFSAGPAAHRCTCRARRPGADLLRGDLPRCGDRSPGPAAVAARDQQRCVVRLHLRTLPAFRDHARAGDRGRAPRGARCQQRYSPA